MSTTIDYRKLMYEAMQGVVRQALRVLAEEGRSPRNHSLYITFRTQDPGVELAPGLVDAYPDVMTIVLQHQFWDLEVDEEGFSVGLSFSSTPHVVRIPFAAVVSFADPPAEFGLRFVPPEELEETATGPVPVDERSDRLPAPAPKASAKEEEPPREAQVVSIDAFRKR